MSLERRLAALESRIRVGSADFGARERLVGKIASLVDAHVRRAHGEDVDDVVLENQSIASLLALIHSHSYGSVPFSVAHVATEKSRALNPIAHRLVTSALASKGYSRGA